MDNMHIKLFLILILFRYIYPNLTSIIKVEEENFRYTRFSSNSNGDMFFDTSQYPGSDPSFKKRIFVGLKKNGRFFFDNIFFSLNGNKLKYEGESIFVKYSDQNEDNGKEVLCSIARNAEDTTFSTEIYDMNDKIIDKIYDTTEVFDYLISDSFNIEKMPNESGSTYYYILAYIIKNTDNYYLTIRKIFFTKERFEITELIICKRG